MKNLWNRIFKPKTGSFLVSYTFKGDCGSYGTGHLSVHNVPLKMTGKSIDETVAVIDRSLLKNNNIINSKPVITNMIRIYED